MPGLEEIEHKEEEGDNAVVDAISQEWICGRGQEFEIAAEKNECRHVPAHNKHSHCDTYNGKADGGNISKIFRSQIKRVGTKTFHEHPIHRAEKNKPEYKQNLVSPEMQEK